MFPASVQDCILQAVYYRTLCDTCCLSHTTEHPASSSSTWTLQAMNFPGCLVSLICLVSRTQISSESDPVRSSLARTWWVHTIQDRPLTSYTKVVILSRTFSVRTWFPHPGTQRFMPMVWWRKWITAWRTHDISDLTAKFWDPNSDIFPQKHLILLTKGFRASLSMCMSDYLSRQGNNIPGRARSAMSRESEWAQESRTMTNRPFSSSRTSS